MKSNHSHSTKESFESCRMTLLSLGAFSKNGQNDASIHRAVLAHVGVHWRSETDHTVICAKVMVFLVRSTFTHRLWKEAIICVIQAERLSAEM